MFYIVKASGEKEPFDIKKFRRSLYKAGASPKLANQIVEEIIALHPTSTKEIHEYAIQLLKQESRPVAARYNIKRALMDFGPAGFPFEKFIAQLLQQEGYRTKINQQVYGACIWYEIDIVAQKEDKHYIIECKFHNQPGLKSDVKVTLYNKARFDDIRHASKHYHQPWIITNTKFTTVAIKYATCVGIRLIGWSYPEEDNLPALIDKFGLHPITTLTTLSKAQKRMLLDKGVVLCRDMNVHKEFLQTLGLSERKINQLIAESQAVCELKNSSE